MSEQDSLRDWPEVHERYPEYLDVDPKLGREASLQQCSPNAH